MKLLLKLLFLVLNVGSIVLTTRAQELSAPGSVTGQKATDLLSGYFKNYPREKAYLHCDQDFYFSGQKMWYKAYLLSYGKPSELSKILYVRLSDAHGNIITEDKQPVDKGAGYGNLDLPDTLHTGWYQLNVFTAWMLNFDKTSVFHQYVYIQNATETYATNLNAGFPKKYHLEIYPEAGQMIEGTICNIAFKATDELGLPASVHGEILDEKKKTVGNFSTVHDGMGSFKLEDPKNEGLVLRAHFPDSTIQYVPLPEFKKSGLAMQVEPFHSDELVVRISNVGQLENSHNISLVAVQNDGTVATYPLVLKRGTNIFSLKKNDFSTGILRLSIFDDKPAPTVERLVFIHHNDIFRLAVTNDTSAKSGKTKAFTIGLKDNQAQPATKNLSVSVTDAAIGNEPADNICSYFLLTSELRNHINRPGYYFENNSEKLQRELDLVMLTSKWTPLSWDVVLDNKPHPLSFFAEKSQVIGGQIDAYHANEDLKIKLVITSSIDSGRTMTYVEPDNTGKFSLTGYNKTGSVVISYEVVNAKNKKQDRKITFFRQNIDSIRFTMDTLEVLAKSKPTISKSLLERIASEKRSKGITLQEVTIKDKKHNATPTQQLIQQYVKHFASDKAYSLDLVNNTYPPINIIEYIRGRFPGLEILGPPGGNLIFHYHGINELPQQAMNKDGQKSDLPNPDSEKPFFYVDEAQTTIDELLTIPLTEVALIQFVPPPVWFAPLNGGSTGAILVYTKNADGRHAKKSTFNGFQQYLFTSYSKRDEFNLPRDDMSSQTNTAAYGITRYWSHDTRVNSNEKAGIQFYDPAPAKRYRVVIQGIDANGKLGYFCEDF